MLEVVNESSSDPRVSAEAQQVLRDQTVTEDAPGTILADFATLLEFIGEDGLKTTSKHYLLPQNRLSELNDRMRHPVPHRLKRPQQRSFPHLHGLYMILRASGLSAAKGTPPAGRLTIDPQMWDTWRDLNVTEQYFALLESWLVLSSPDIIGDEGGWSSHCFGDVNSIYQRLKKRRTTIDSVQRIGLFRRTKWLTTVALMELFGWLRLEYATPKDGDGVEVAAIERLALGDAMASALIVFDRTNGWPYPDETTAKPGILQPLFQPYFPEWQGTLEFPEWSFREGTYTWRVSIGRVWRRIVATADMSLDELAMAILESLEFDVDHLYCFELRDTHGRKLRIACPFEQDEKFLTDEFKLGDLPLSEGGVMTFVFDYGDYWQFTVLLEEISPTVSEPKQKLKRPEVSAQGGRPPVQYARDDYDDEDDDDDEWE